MPLDWKEVPAETLGGMLSTGEAQPLARAAWPPWARDSARFSGAWFSFVGGEPATSTGALSTDNVLGYVDVERTAREQPTFRYYRHYYLQMTDGRVFHAGPIKELEYDRRREERPHWLASYISKSAST